MTLQVGEPVRVAARAHAGHHRTPSYIKGKTGRIERVHAEFPNPETRAYGEDGLPKMPLYLVSFGRSDVWPGARAGGNHRVYVDVFEHWLESAR